MKNKPFAALAALFVLTAAGCASPDRPKPSVAPVQKDATEIRRNVNAAKSDLQNIEEEANRLAK